MMMINEAEHKPVEKFSFGWNKKGILSEYLHSEFR